ncbi:MAG TPA: hypothetical protein VNW15_02170 [Rhizomicrobium sp.]|nr:hypothetical protein [Rhizomicrobium sp.]
MTFSGMSWGPFFSKGPKLGVGDKFLIVPAMIALQNQCIAVRATPALAIWMYFHAILRIDLLAERLAMLWRRDFGTLLLYFSLALSFVNQNVKRGSTQTGSGRRISRLVLTGFMLFAFLLQSYATQSHIHFSPDASTVAKITADQTAPAKKNTPGNDNPDNCPLCQLLYGGQYVAPDALVFFLPMVAVSVIEAVQGAMPHYDAVSHSWRGRAPPRR